MNRDSKLVGSLALLALGLWVSFGSSLAAFPGGTPAAQHAPNRAPVHRARPLDTPSPTPASTEPEWAILQYVITAHPFWTCGAIGGTPGHRSLNCVTGAGHDGYGRVDNYGDPGTASATWQQRRTQAQSLYTTFQNTMWTGYPGYHGEGTLPPYNFFTQEDYYWADIRVLGGTRVDDTHFHYAPDIATAIMEAAAALGYLPPPTPTPSPIRTSTPLPSPSVTPCLLQFVDVAPGSPFYADVRCLACRGIVGGYPCGAVGEPCPGLYYRPNTLVTRGQVSKIVANAAGWNDPVPSTQQTFADVAPGSPFYLWVERLSTRGLIGGYPCGGPLEPCVAPANRPYFRPGADVTRGQLAKITSGAAGYTEPSIGQTFADVPPGSPFYDYIERLSVRGIIGGYPCGGAGAPCVPPTNRPYFRPNGPATRGQMSKIAARTFYPNCATPGPTPTATNTPAATVTALTTPTPPGGPTGTPSASPTPNSSCAPGAGITVGAVVSDPNPPLGTSVTVYGTICNNGVPLAGIPMTTIWHERNYTSGCSGSRDPTASPVVTILSGSARWATGCGWMSHSP